MFFGSDDFSLKCLQALRLKDISQISHLAIAFEHAKGSFAQTNLIQEKHFLAPSWSHRPLPGQFDLGIVASFGSFIPRRLIDQFTLKNVLNIHPSHLPKYRGPAPIQRMIIDGVGKSAVCIIDCNTATYDSGDIWASQEMTILPCDTLDSVFSKAADISAELIAQILSDRGAFQRIPQLGTPSYAPKITRADAEIRELSSSIKIERIVRAISHQFKPFAKPPLLHPTKTTFLTKVNFGQTRRQDSPFVLDEKERILWLKCIDGSSLGIKSFRLEGKSNTFDAFYLHDILSRKAT